MVLMIFIHGIMILIVLTNDKPVKNKEYRRVRSEESMIAFKSIAGTELEWNVWENRH